MKRCVPTVTERAEVRHYVYRVPGVTMIELWENDDNSWAIEVSGKVFEASTASEALRFLADALGES